MQNININVINNAGKNVKVTINEKGNGIEILIDTVHNKTRLSDLKQYDHFFDDDGEEYILCRLFEDGTASVLKAELLEKEMMFGKNNNWAESCCREYLNSEYLKELERKFGSDNIVAHKVDLAFDGFGDYGYTIDKVAIRTFDEFIETSVGVGIADSVEWLATPISIFGCENSSCYVRAVDLKGYVNYIHCYYTFGVRPFFLLKSSIFVSENQRRIINIK